jgi:cell wall-associated NlpC family hydrolase
MPAEHTLQEAPLTIPVTLDSPAPGYIEAVGRIQQIMNPQVPAPAAASPGFAGRLASAMTPTPTTMTDAATGGFLGAPGAPGAYGAPAAGAFTPVTGVSPLSGLSANGTVGQRMAAIATAELGVAEQPPGSNDAPRIAEYRTATANSGVGPWCSYFVSWVAANAGVPIGPNGQGEGWVPSVRTWAESQGRYIPAGQGAPAVGDLVVFDRTGTGVLDHIGIVTGVAADGSIQTVEGNSSDAVSARSYGPGGYAGLVRLG